MFDFLAIHGMAKNRFGKESPTSRACVMTILRTPCVFMAATLLAAESATTRGGDMGLEKGLSLARRALRVMITYGRGEIGWGRSNGGGDVGLVEGGALD